MYRRIALAIIACMLLPGIPVLLGFDERSGFGTLPLLWAVTVPLGAVALVILGIVWMVKG